MALGLGVGLPRTQRYDVSCDLVRLASRWRRPTDTAASYGRGADAPQTCVRAKVQLTRDAVGRDAGN